MAHRAITTFYLTSRLPECHFQTNLILLSFIVARTTKQQKNINMIDYALFMIDLPLCKCGARHNLIAEYIHIYINDWKEMNQKRANEKKQQQQKQNAHTSVDQH